MFNFFKKEQKELKKKIFKVKDMDCSACAVHIDMDLEELPGITASKTTYAKSQTEVTYDPTKISQSSIIDQIKKTGYDASPIDN